MNPFKASSSSAPPLPAPPLPVPGEHWALFLDVDGTLLDFADHPDAVSVPASLRALLDSLHHLLDGAFALVSGRSVSNLSVLFADPPWAMAGLHGLQLRYATGKIRDYTMDTPLRVRLKHGAAGIVTELGDDIYLEDKGIAIALHCRRHPERLDELALAASALVRSLPGYELQPGNMVMEIKPAGMNKGMAVNELMHSPPFRGRIPVYVGDDFTDEHAFTAAAHAGGFGICVGARLPTAAHFSLPNPQATHRWLTHLLGALTQGTDPHA